MSFLLAVCPPMVICVFLQDFLEKKDHYLELDERVDSLLKEVNGLRSRMALQDLEDVIENEEMEVDTSGLGLFGDNAEAIKKLEEELEESKLECTKLREDLKVCVAERDENAARLKVCVAERDKDIAKFAKLEEDFKVCVEERDENAAKSIKLQEEIDTLRAASSDSLEKEKNNKKKRQREEEATSEEASQRPSKQPTTMSSSYQSLLSAMTAMSQELSDAQTNNENLKKEFNSKLLKLKNECEELRGREDKNVAMTEYDDAIIKMEALLKIHERIVSSSLMKVRVEVGNNAELSKRVVALTKDKKKAIARKEEYKNVWLQLKANEAGFKAEKAGLLVKLDEANKSIKTFERNRDLMKSIADVIVSVGSEEGMPLMLTKTTLDMAISQAKMSDRENGVARDEYDSDLGEGEDAGEEEREDTMDAEKDE